VIYANTKYELILTSNCQKEKEKKDLNTLMFSSLGKRCLRMDLKKHCSPGADSDSGAASVLALVERQLARVLAFLASAPTGAAGRAGGVLASASKPPAMASESDRSCNSTLAEGFPALGARGGGQDCLPVPMMSAVCTVATGWQAAAQRQAWTDCL